MNGSEGTSRQGGSRQGRAGARVGTSVRASADVGVSADVGARVTIRARVGPGGKVRAGVRVRAGIAVLAVVLAGIAFPVHAQTAVSQAGVLSWIAATVSAQTAGLEAGRSAYVLSCGGCHGLEGVSNSRLVPDLKDQVGFFLNLREGRAYVARLPNVAFSQNTDEALTGMLNYVVFSLGGASVPKGARPYSVREVAQLRRHPLTEVNLTEMRRRMVGILIGQYNASAELRLYGEADYGDSTE